MLKQQIFMKIRSVECELLHEHGGTDRHDEANSLSRNSANEPKSLSRCLTLPLGGMAPNSELRGDRPPHTQNTTLFDDVTQNIHTA